MWLPSERAVLEIHARVVEHHDDAPAGVLRPGALEAAVERARHGPFPGEGGVHDRVALLVRGIVNGHPFVDGNKRTAFQVLRTVLDENGYHLTASREEAREMLLALARGEQGIEALGHWIRERSRKLDGEDDQHGG